MNQKLIRHLPLASMAILVLPAYAFATPGPSVVSFDVLFGTQSFNLSAIPRADLPWEITGAEVTFSEVITAGDANSLSGAGVTPVGISGLGTNTLTWTFAPLADGNYSIDLAGSGTNALTDASNNGLNGGSGSTQDFSVLIGDFNDDGQVNSTDVTDVNDARSEPYNLFADINGDGVVDANDVSLVQDHESPTAVPEPTTIGLLALGFVGLGLSRRKARARS